MQIKKVTNTLIASKYTLPSVVFICFVLFSLGFNGPAYMSDEVGYLDKAATIAGSTVHLSTSWFGGYSFMISPAFFLSGNPYHEWDIVIVLNALMWSGSVALLQYIIRKLYPERSNKAIFLASLGAMLYPSWISMSGYAFATSGFVLVFLASLAALARSELQSRRWLALAGALAGYLCWIHPLGFVYLALFIATLLLQQIRRRPSLLLIAVGSAAVGLLYIGAVQPWFNRAMRGSVNNDNHYAAGTHGLLHTMLTFHYWVLTGELLVGLLFFAVVATFGLVVYGSNAVVKELYANRQAWRKYTQDPATVVRLLPVLLVLGVIVLTALQSAASTPLRMDQWVYGRYTDMYVMPLLAYGLLANWKAKTAVALAGFVLAAGVLLSLVANQQNTLFNFDNKVNIQAMWPMHVASVVHADHYWVWGTLGMVGVLWAGLMGGPRRKAYLSLLVFPILLAGAGNHIYKQTITRQHATVSSLYSYIRSNYSASECIGFTPVPDSNERFNLYSYYLHGYDIEKMSMAQWQQRGCQGPYLGYEAPSSSQPSLQVAGVEPTTGLYMITQPSTRLAVGSNDIHDLSQTKLTNYAITFH